MRTPSPVVLERGSVRLEPMREEHAAALREAAADGALWDLWFTVVPEPAEAEAYVATALRGLDAGHMLPWVVRDLESGAVIGSTRYHDVVTEIDRVEIGYTWYARSWQRTHVNTTCKLMLFAHAFETLGCRVVGLRTDNFNFPSKRVAELAEINELRGLRLTHDQLRAALDFLVLVGKAPRQRVT